MNFSVVLIARNESKTLPRLVESLKEFQSRNGEIVLLDTGSKDSTAQVARDLGCIVHEVGDKFRIFIDKTTADNINSQYIVEGEEPILKEGDSLFDYSSARNYAAGLASNDVVAMPDCDEIYTKLDLDAINQKIKSGVQQLEYQFVFSHDDLGKPLIQFLHCKFYDRRALKWVGIIHEVLSGSARREYLDESIIKLEHYQNVETNRNGYLTGLALDCYKDPSNDRNAHYFARELMYKDRYKSAIKAFKVHVEMNKWPEERAQSMIYIGECYNYLGQPDKSFKWFLKALDACPDRREPLMKLSEQYFQKNSPKHVIMYAEAALTITGSSFYSNYQPYYSNLPHELLYWAYWWNGNKAKSKEHYDIAYSMQPNNPKYLQDRQFYYQMPKISIVVPTLGRPEGLEKCLNSIKNSSYPQDLLETVILDGPGTVPAKMVTGVKQAKGDFILFGANDVEFHGDTLAIASAECQAKNLKFLAFNTGTILPDEGNICEHFMIHKDIIPFLDKGEVFCTEMHHVGVDNYLWAQVKKLGFAYRSDLAILNHYHFSKTGKPLDDIYQHGWSKVNEDRAILSKKLKELV